MPMCFFEDGLQFSCTSCGHCCRHEPGYVFLSQNDVHLLAAHLNLTEGEIIKIWCRTVKLALTTRLSLREKDNYDCIFWDNGCTVYVARPLQCRTYPFWPALLRNQDAWDSESRECPGMNQGRSYSKDEIGALLQARAEELLINPTEIS